MWLPNYEVYLNTPSQDIDLGNAKGFGLRNDGNGYIWYQNDDLILNTPILNYNLGTVQAFALRNDGNGYMWFPNDELYLNTPSQDIDLGNAKGFGLRNDGNGFIWYQNDDLILNTPFKNYEFGTVKAFALRNDGNGYVLTTGGDLYLNTPSQNIDFSACYGAIQALLVDGSGNGYFLTGGGNLYKNTISSNTLVDVNVSSFHFNSSGQLVAAFLAPPAAVTAYTPVSGSLFGPNGPSYQDVEQGGLGDCWLLASLAEVAARAPAEIQNMFTYVGTGIAPEDGSTVSFYSVRFFNSAGVAEHVTVDTELPSGGGYYDHPANGVLWVALAEKAYAEANGEGFVTTSNVGSDSYNALNGGDPSWALQAMTGKTANDCSVNTTNIAGAWNAGELIVIWTGDNPVSPYIVPDHAYAVVGYNPSSNMPFEVYNPWGTDSSGWALGTYEGQQVYGLFVANASFLSVDYIEQSLGTGTTPGLNELGNSLGAGAGRVNLDLALSAGRPSSAKVVKVSWRIADGPVAAINRPSHVIEKTGTELGLGLIAMPQPSPKPIAHTDPWYEGMVNTGAAASRERSNDLSARIACPVA